MDNSTQLSSETMDTFKEALINKDTSLLDKLITKESVLQRDNLGDTFLHIVAKQGTIEIASKLLKLGANRNVQNKQKQIPVCYAVQNSPQMVKFLLNDEKIKNLRLLCGALVFGCEETVRLVINALPVDSKSILTDDSKDIEKLINRLLYHEIHLSNVEYTYPLLIFFAGRIESDSVLQLILNDCRTFLKETHCNYKACLAIMKIEHYRQEQYEREINFQGRYDKTALYYAINGQMVKVMKFLLQRGADPNNILRFGNKLYKPLHYTSLFIKNEEISESLVRYGADINATFTWKTNPLDLISQALNENYFNPKTMRNLLKNSIDINSRDFNGMTSFLIASQAGHLELMKILLEFNADIRAVDNKGNSALHHAAIGNSLETLNFLILTLNIEINTKNKNGETFLFHFIKNTVDTNLEAVKNFVNQGASLLTKDNSNKNILKIAEYYSHFQLLNLLELGANSIKQEIINDDSIENILILESGLQFFVAFFVLHDDSDYLNFQFKRDKNKMGLKFIEESLIEVKKLKSVIILDEEMYTFHDFLTRDLLTAYRIVKKLKNSRKIIYTYQRKCEFVYYDAFIARRFKSVNIVEKGIPLFFSYFLNYCKIKLPILVVEKILGYLSCKDIRLFGDALAKFDICHTIFDII